MLCIYRVIFPNLTTKTVTIKGRMWEIVFIISGFAILLIRSYIVKMLDVRYQSTKFGAILLRIYTSLVIYSLVGRFLCNIDIEETYTWYSGIWHGLCLLPNLARYLIFDAEFKAEYCTTAYNVFFWIMGVLSTLKFIEYDSRFMYRLYNDKSQDNSLQE